MIITLVSISIIIIIIPRIFDPSAFPFSVAACPLD